MSGRILFNLCQVIVVLAFAPLAVTCFVRVFAMSFLGMRRLEDQQKVTKAKSAALVPMFILATLCLAFGVLPTYIIPVLGLALAPLVGGNAADALVPPFFATNPAHHTLPPARRPRWDGGVRRLWPEMTYTATGFSNPVRVIFDAVFQPTTVADTRETVAEHFRIAIRREKECVHLVERLVFKPTREAAFWCAALLAAMHHGRFNAYAA